MQGSRICVWLAARPTNPLSDPQNLQIARIFCRGAIY